MLAAVRYLRKAGAKTVSVVGGSMGGGAAGDASVEAEPDEIDRLVFLGSAGSGQPEKMKGRKLFLIARDDLGPGDIPRLPRVREHFEKTPGPKELIVLEGSAHAQFLFDDRPGRARDARDLAVPFREVSGRQVSTPDSCISGYERVRSRRQRRGTEPMPIDATPVPGEETLALRNSIVGR